MYEQQRIARVAENRNILMQLGLERKQDNLMQVVKKRRCAGEPATKATRKSLPRGAKQAPSKVPKWDWGPGFWVRCNLLWITNDSACLHGRVEGYAEPNGEDRPEGLWHGVYANDDGSVKQEELTSEYLHQQLLQHQLWLKEKEKEEDGGRVFLPYCRADFHVANQWAQANMPESQTLMPTDSITRGRNASKRLPKQREPVRNVRPRRYKTDDEDPNEFASDSELEADSDSDDSDVNDSTFVPGRERDDDDDDADDTDGDTSECDDNASEVSAVGAGSDGGGEDEAFDETPQEKDNREYSRVAMDMLKRRFGDKWKNMNSAAPFLGMDRDEQKAVFGRLLFCMISANPTTYSGSLKGPVYTCALSMKAMFFGSTGKGRGGIKVDGCFDSLDDLMLPDVVKRVDDWGVKTSLAIRPRIKRNGPKKICFYAVVEQVKKQRGFYCDTSDEESDSSDALGHLEVQEQAIEDASAGASAEVVHKHKEVGELHSSYDMDLSTGSQESEPAMLVEDPSDPCDASTSGEDSQSSLCDATTAESLFENHWNSVEQQKVAENMEKIQVYSEIETDEFYDDFEDYGFCIHEGADDDFCIHEGADDEGSELGNF